MAYPVADTYSAASGQPIYGGRYAVPTWLSSIPKGEWGVLPSSTLTTSGAGWAGTNPGGSNDYKAIVSAWGGGVLNTVGCYYDGSFHSGTFLCIWGGGHSDYAGNELYAFGPIDTNSPTWHRLTDPTIPAPSDVARLNGYPVSRHTYDNLVYLPDTNQMLSMGCYGTYPGALAPKVGDLFDFDKNPAVENPWTTADTNYPLFNSAGTSSLVSGYNPLTNRAYGLGYSTSNLFSYFDTVSGVWSSNGLTGYPGMATNSKGAIDLVHGVMATFTNTGAICAVDLANPTAFYMPTVVGTGPATSVNACLDWDASAGQFVSRQNSGATVYRLTPGANPLAGGDAWSWSSTSPAGLVPPDTSATNGTYGRFRYVNSLGGVLFMPFANQPIHFFRT